MSRHYRQGSSIGDLNSSSLSGSDHIASVLENSALVYDAQARGIYDRVEEGWDSKFSRIGIIDPYTTVTSTKEYVFFVKPDLHLYDNGLINPELRERSTFFADAIDRYPHVADQLQFSNSMGRAGGVLSPLLSNALTGALDLPGISADTYDTPQNVRGTKIEYRGSSYKSDEGYDFTLDFTDTKYLETYMYFKMYDEYEKLKNLGQVTPTSKAYIRHKNLHDQTAIYKFIVGEDGMTLLYWARIMGTFPTSVPREAFGKVDGDLTYSISWHGQFVEDMDPAILTDFNSIVAPYAGGRRIYPLYDSRNHRFDPRWAVSPWIHIRGGASTTTDKLNKYYLMWVR